MQTEAIPSNKIFEVGQKEPVLAAGETSQLEKVKKVAQSSNLGYHLVQLGQTVYGTISGQINSSIQEANKIRKTLDLLIELNGKFSIHSDKDKEKPVTDEIRSLCEQLKANGIDILPEKEDKLTRERIAEIKANIGVHTERQKSDLQILLTTEVQVAIQFLQSSFDIFKKGEESSRSNGIIRNIGR